jgi:ankyrin repeat protein
MQFRFCFPDAQIPIVGLPGRTLNLANALTNGDTSFVRLLLNKGVVSGSAEITGLLLVRRGVSVDSKNHSERTPLYFAAEHGYSHVGQLLLEHGRTAQADVMNRLSSTPLAYNAAE